jgi:hypothetical protein
MLLSFLISCSDNTSDSGVSFLDSSPLQIEETERTLITQTYEEAEGVAVINEHLLLVRTSDSTFILDERDGSKQDIGLFSSISATEFNDLIVVALDGIVFTVVNNTLEPLFDSFQVPIDSLSVEGDDLWLFGAGRLFRWSDNVLVEFSLPEYDFIYSYTAAEDRLWIATPWLIEIDLNGDSSEVSEVYEYSVDSLTNDVDGNVWFVSNEGLWVIPPDKLPLSYDITVPVLEVLGPEIWIRTDNSAYFFDKGRFSNHSIATGDWKDVDKHGRLVQLDNGIIKRHSIGRPVVVVGLSEFVMVQERVQLLPSDPETVTNIRVWLNQQELSVDADPWEVDVNPEGLDAGEHTMRIVCESSDDTTIDEQNIVVADLPYTEWNQIEAISDQYCLSCHGGESLTYLVTKEDWEQNINDIIEQVSVYEMPLGGPYLSVEQIAQIRGWKQGGFQ